MIGEKSQPVRLLDVLLLGPFLVAAGAKKSTLPTWMRVGLVGAGVATVGYNLHNYLQTAPSSDELERVDPQELIAGTVHELEHTGDFDVAKRIALDHLQKDPSYYTKLRGAGL